MAEIKPMALIESMKKKVCEHSDVYFRTNKKTGKVTTGKLCNPSTKEPSAAQIAAKARFAKVSAAVRAILAGTSEQKTQLVAEYKAQNKYGSLRLGASAGSDTHEFVGWAHVGYEHNYVLRHGWHLYWQIKTEVCINGQDLFRTGLVLGIKLPTGTR